MMSRLSGCVVCIAWVGGVVYYVEVDILDQPKRRMQKCEH